VAPRVIHVALPQFAVSSPLVSLCTSVRTMAMAMTSTRKMTVVMTAVKMARKTLKHDAARDREQSVGSADMNVRKARPQAMGWRTKSAVRAFEIVWTRFVLTPNACVIVVSIVKPRCAGVQNVSPLTVEPKAETDSDVTQYPHTPNFADPAPWAFTDPTVSLTTAESVKMKMDLIIGTDKDTSSRSTKAAKMKKKPNIAVWSAQLTAGGELELE